MSPIKATTYYVIAEALTNVQKHAGARRVEVGATTAGETLLVEVSDDRIGGADPEGNGPRSLADRVRGARRNASDREPSRAGNPPGGSLPADLSLASRLGRGWIPVAGPPVEPV